MSSDYLELGKEQPQIVVVSGGAMYFCMDIVSSGSGYANLVPHRYSLILPH